MHSGEVWCINASVCTGVIYASIQLYSQWSPATRRRNTNLEVCSLFKSSDNLNCTFIRQVSATVDECRLCCIKFDFISWTLAIIEASVVAILNWVDSKGLAVVDVHLIHVSCGLWEIPLTDQKTCLQTVSGKMSNNDLTSTVRPVMWAEDQSPPPQHQLFSQYL